MLLCGRRLAHNTGCRNPAYRYRYSTHDPPGNRRIQALGNPRNGMIISVTRLQHLTLNRLKLYDNTQPYIYPATYGSWDTQNN